MEIFYIMVSGVGAAFCFVLAGGILTERDGTSSEADMLELFAPILEDAA